MNGRAIRYSVALALAVLAVIHPGSAGFQNSLKAENVVPPKSRGHQQAGAVPSPTARQAPAPAGKPDRLVERESEVSLKEQELRRLGETLESRIKQLDEVRKGIEASVTQKKKEDSEKYAKMLKVYKSLRPEAAAVLINRLDEDMAIEMLNRMDQKTTVKLIPFLNQDRVLKWTRLSLKGN